MTVGMSILRPLPPTSHNLRANTPLVSSKGLIFQEGTLSPFAQSSAAVVPVPAIHVQHCWHWEWHGSHEGLGPRLWLGNPRRCLEAELQRMSLVGRAEPKCYQELCLSWLLAVGAGEDMGTPLGHCWQGLAALRCSSAGAATP